MPATRDAHLWSGDRAEDLGVFLLRRLSCTVTEVRRQDDVGIDAVATYLKPNGRRMMARGSFFVQIKSASVGHVPFADEQIDWLFDQRLPLFFAWVAQPSLSMAVFAFDPSAIHCIPYRRLGLHRQLHLLPGKGALAERADGRLDVHLGDPVLSVAAADTGDLQKLESLRGVVEAWVALAQSLVEQRRFGVFQAALWETNALPRPSWPTTVCEKNATPQVASSLSYALPALSSIKAHVNATGSDAEKVAAEVVHQFMRRHGARESWE